MSHVGRAIAQLTCSLDFSFRLRSADAPGVVVVVVAGASSDVGLSLAAAAARAPHRPPTLEQRVRVRWWVRGGEAGAGRKEDAGRQHRAATVSRTKPAGLVNESRILEALARREKGGESGRSGASERTLTEPAAQPAVYTSKNAVTVGGCGGSPGLDHVLPLGPGRSAMRQGFSSLLPSFPSPQPTVYLQTFPTPLSLSLVHSGISALVLARATASLWMVSTSSG